MPMTRYLIHWRPLILLIAMAASTATIGAEFNALPFNPSPVPGGVAIIPIHGKPQASQVTYHGEPVLTRRSAKGWTAVVDEIASHGHSGAFTGERDPGSWEAPR